MMQKQALILTTWLLVSFVSTIQASPLGEAEVRTAATRFLAKPFFGEQFKIATLSAPTKEIPYWTATLDPAGFLILSSDSDELPVLGFSTTGRLNTDANIENAMPKMLANRVSLAPITTDSHPSPRIKPSSNTSTNQILLDPQAPSRILVEPLLATHWTQWTPFNNYCPVVSTGLNGYGGRAPTGCVPVVLGQVLRYYSWPDIGIGTNTWADTNGVSTGTYTAEWNHPIRWWDMKDSFQPGCSDAPELVNPLAELMFKLGVAAQMDYEPNGSGSDVMILARSLATNLNYTIGELVQSTNKNYGATVIKEITELRPVIMNINTIPSHTVVADGLAEDGGVKFVHINYGWAGQNDGWYAGFDKPATNMWFDSIISTFRPNTVAAYASCAPNFMELTVTNGIIPDQSLAIIGFGTNSIQYALTNSQPWVTIDPGEGTAAMGKKVHQIKIDAQQLAIGTNMSVIEINGNATNLPRTVQILAYKSAPPSITQQPVGRKTYNPTNNVIEIKAMPGTNYGPCAIADTVNYQWFYNATPMVGKTNSWCYSSGYGAYYCQVTGAGGSVRSQEAVLEPYPPKPVITEQPQGYLVNAGDTIHLHVAASGQEPLSYFWFYDQNPVTLSTTDTLVITNATLANAGYYYAVVSNEGGPTYSAFAEIKVKEAKGSRIKLLQISGGKMKFQLENVQSTQILLLTSTNLINWTTSQILQVSTPTVTLSIPYPASDKTRYYRLKE